MDQAVPEPKSGPRGASRAEALALAGVLLAFVVAATLFNLLHPLWEAPDEANHYAFVRHLVEQRSLPPVIPFWSERLGGETEAHQPPLYYALQALLVGWVDDGTEAEWHRNPYATWPNHPARWAIALHRQEEIFPFAGYAIGAHLARFVSTLMGTATVLFTYLIARRLVASRLVALLAAAIAAFTPGFAFLNGTVNNDNGVTLGSALTMWHCVRLLQQQQVSWRDGAASGILLGAAALTKLSALLLGVLVGATWLVLLWRRRSAPAPVLRAALPLPILFIALFAWWPYSMRDVWELVQVNSTANFPAAGLLPPAGGYNAQHLLDGARLMFGSYWGRFGWVDELMLPTEVNLTIGAFCLVALIGLARMALGARPRALTRNTPALLLAGYALAATYMLYNRYQLLPEGYAMQGRLLYPALPVLSLALALGLRAATGRFVALTAAPVLFLAAVTFAVPFTVSRDAFVPPYPVWGVFDQSRVEKRLDLAYANGVTLLGLSPGSWELRPGEALQFDAFWRADSDLKTDMLAAFRLVDPTGEVPVSDHQTPQERVFPPRLWQRGEVVPDSRRLAIPADALPGAYRLQLRLLDHTAVVDVPKRKGDGSGGWTDIAAMRVRPAGSTTPEIALPQAANFGGQLSLLGHSRQESATAGKRSLAVTLFWRALSVPSEDYHVSVQVLDSEGRLRAQHDGAPQAGRYPTSRWEQGEVVPDRHEVELPAELAGGRLVVVVYRPGDGTRLALDGGAQHLELGAFGSR